MFVKDSLYITNTRMFFRDCHMDSKKSGLLCCNNLNISYVYYKNCCSKRTIINIEQA